MGFLHRRTKCFSAGRAERVLIGVDRVVTSIDQRDAKVYEGIACNGSALRGFDYSFLHGGTEILRDRAAEDLIDPFETRPAIKRFKDHFTVSELTAATGLFLMPALNFDLLRDRLLVRNLRR